MKIRIIAESEMFAGLLAGLIGDVHDVANDDAGTSLRAQLPLADCLVADGASWAREELESLAGLDSTELPQSVVVVWASRESPSGAVTQVLRKPLGRGDLRRALDDVKARRPTTRPPARIAS